MPNRQFQVVRPGTPVPERYSAALYLAGSAPSSEASSWTTMALEQLAQLDYTGVVFVPDAAHVQSDWADDGLHLADTIVFWFAGEKEGVEADTQFGSWVGTGKCVYGRREGGLRVAERDRVFAREARGTVHDTLPAALAEAVGRVGEGALREGGERWVPLHLWRTSMFQAWYASQRRAQNVLREARLRWAFVLPGTHRLLAAVTWVDIWVAAEGRAKSNEWIFSRSDISSVVLYERPDPRRYSIERLLDQSIVLVREFRSAARTEDAFVHELPGGSSIKEELDPRVTAAAEVTEETGLELKKDRFELIESRQAAATVSTHHIHLFAAALTRSEMQQAQRMADTKRVHGNPSETERTMLEVTSLREMLRSDLIDWSTLGMVLRALFRWRGYRKQSR